MSTLTIQGIFEPLMQKSGKSAEASIRVCCRTRRKNASGGGRIASIKKVLTYKSVSKVSLNLIRTKNQPGSPHICIENSQTLLLFKFIIFQFRCIPMENKGYRLFESVHM